MSGGQQLRSNLPDKNGTSATASNGDSFTKVADSSSVSEGDNSALDKFIGDKVNYLQHAGIRFTPSVLEFIDAFQGKQFSEKIVIQNIGRNPAVIKIGEPTSFIFQLKKPSRRKIFLASGTSISRTITYTYHNDDLVQKSRIPIFINGNQIDYPIVVKKAIPELEVEPPKIDFGTVNLGSEVKTLVLTIRNTGGTRSKYEIDVGKNDLDLVVNPMRGTVKAKHQVKVTVEIMGMKEGEFYKEIWIKTNEMPIRVPVYVEVVRPRLLVIYPNGTEELSAIDFPPTFNGTQKAVPFILKNGSGETALFITVGEVNGEHQFLDEARKNHEAFNFFNLTAEEGRLEPHESRVFTALFRPEAVKQTKGWHHQEKAERKPQVEHVVFFTMNRVHCIERKEIEKACSPFYGTTSQKSSLNLRTKMGSPILVKHVKPVSVHIPTALIDAYDVKENGFRLCLRGKSVKPEILLQPSKFYLGELHVGRTEQRVLTITNKSIIRVKCVLLKKMNVRVKPKQLWIGPEKAHEFTVWVTPTCAGKFHHVIKIQILGESDVVYATDKPLRVVAEFPVSVSFTATHATKILSPKIGLGITPLITDGVGINKELVTFSNASKVPYAAKLLSLNEEFKPMWMRMKSTQIDNAMMALPNDRPRGFQTWPKDKTCRSIFKGWLRYAPPKDPLYTFPSQEEILRMRNNAVWVNYLFTMREIRESYRQQPTELRDVLHSNYWKQLQEYPTTPKFKKKPVTFNSQDCLVPLSPMFLSYVTVEPKMINYGVVAVDNPLSANLKIKNHNVFPIAIKFIPGNSAVTLNEGTVIVHPDSEKTAKVWFELGTLGRYYGFLNYVINGSHEFKITISAFVMSRSIIVEPKTLVFSNYSQHQAFQPKSLFLSMENWLQAAIGYKFHFSADSPYYSALKEGVIPPKSNLLSEIVVDFHPKKPLTAELKVTSDSGEKELVKITHLYKKLPVGFITNRIDLKDIPLNLKTKVTPIIENECFHDVTFEVINGNPMPGVLVEPKSGIIKARSFFPFDIQIQIPVVLQFTFEIDIIIQTSNRVTVKITGRVVLPDIRIKPSIIQMRKICAQSFDRVMICLENAGTTPSEVDIDFRTCPEYKVLKGKSHLYLNPKQVTSVVIMFEPKDAARFVFYLPIIVNNILGPPTMHESETENVYFYLSDLGKMYEFYGEVRDTEKSGEKIPLAILSCTVASSLITVTPSSVTFQQSEPLAGESSEAVSEFDSQVYFPPKSIVISNDSTSVVTFCIRNDDLGKSNDSVFDLQPVDKHNVEYRLKSIKATLEPGKQLSFRATFCPKKPGLYSVQVPVYVRGYNNGVVYCYINLTGELNKPNLIPEADEIHFYPVPLNVSNEFTFTITAENYHRPDFISCIIYESKEKESPDAHKLTTTWLESPEVIQLNGRQKLAIRIGFKSSVPTALRCYLVFVDSNRNYCSVLVTAIADNSSLTLHCFLNLSTYRNKIIRHDCTPPVWKADEFPILFYPFDKSCLYKSERKSYDVDIFNSSNQYLSAIDKGPSLTIQGTLSNAGLLTYKQECDEDRSKFLQDTYVTPSVVTLSCTIKSVQFNINNSFDEIDITYPFYPKEKGFYKSYCDRTLHYVERWIYEVVMRCDQYFMIPTSFRISKKCFPNASKGRARKQKNVFHFLSEIFGDELPNVFELDNVENHDCSANWPSRLHRFYSEVLRLLESQGCFLPHVRPEYLLSYEDYLHVHHANALDTLKPINAELQKNTSIKFFSSNIFHAKTKLETDEFQIQKTNSYLSSKEWFTTKSAFDGLTMPFETEVALEKEENTDANDRSAVKTYSKGVEIVPDPEEELQHTYVALQETEFNIRSTQAWLDIIIQIFRHTVLPKIVYKSTIPEVLVVEPGDKVPIAAVEMSKVSLYGGDKERMTDTHASNIYNVQERMLLLWLNHHLNVQRRQIWCNMNNEVLISKDKIISNFHKDLCDSVALISVTASYCPYVTPQYFRDCFPKPDTPDKFYHNAARLVQAWRELKIGLTVETMDIVRPNSIFMLMLITQLYEVLPALHPQYLTCFEAPLSSQQSRKFSVQSDSGRLVLQPKLLGEDSKYFRLSQASLLELRKGKVEEIKVTFYARKIKKMKATLLLSGYEESPCFAKSLAFFLEGQLTELTESEKLSFSAPLYKVICTEIPIKPPYSGSATYEVWYSTVKPLLSETSDLVSYSKPWSKIWFRKVCRRLFLDTNEVSFLQERKKMFLNVTIACFTLKERFFWLLFRSKTGDFIVRIKIKAKRQKEPRNVANCWYPDTWPECSCAKTDKGYRINWADMRSCPLLTVIKLPSRNDDLWKALQTMFLKSLLPQEKTFWAEHFEKDIGLCIIQWLLSPDEEEEVVNEFVPLLQTHITYTLSPVESKKHLKMPPKIEIKDVRQGTDIVIPVHITRGAGHKMLVEMKSESEMEVRTFSVQVKCLERREDDGESEEAAIVSGACQPCTTTPPQGCQKSKTFARLY